jgi:hypothetical protein
VKTSELWLMSFVMASLAMQGCAVHYFDSKTGTEHIWGFGHMEMKATMPHDGLKAVVRGHEIIGAGVGWVDGRPGLILGWEHQQRLDILESNTVICLEQPTNGLLNTRVGTNFPFQTPCQLPNEPKPGATP